MLQTKNKRSSLLIQGEGVMQTRVTPFFFPSFFFYFLARFGNNHHTSAYH